jgi:hypothetical protein
VVGVEWSGRAAEFHGLWPACKGSAGRRWGAAWRWTHTAEAACLAGGVVILVKWSLSTCFVVMGSLLFSRYCTVGGVERVGGSCGSESWGRDKRVSGRGQQSHGARPIGGP